MKNLTLLIPLLAAAAGHARAATVVTWDLNTPLQSTGVGFAGIDSSKATVATNLTVTTLITEHRNASFSGLSWNSSNSVAGELNLQNWDFLGTGSSATGDGSADNWLQFSVSAAAGYQLDLQQISVTAWRNGAAAAARWSGEYSIDNGATWILLGGVPHDQTTTGSGSATSVNFNGSVTDDSFLIRFTAVGPTGGTGNIHISALSIGGVVSPVPEPSAALLGALSVASLAFLRTRSRSFKL